MEKLKKLNIPLLAFLAFSIRIISIGPNLTDALTLLVFALLYGTSIFIERKYKEVIPLNESIKADIEKLQGAISSLKIAHSQRR